MGQASLLRNHSEVIFPGIARKFSALSILLTFPVTISPKPISPLFLSPTSLLSTSTLIVFILTFFSLPILARPYRTKASFKHQMESVYTQ
jgi:hypothetical protein